MTHTIAAAITAKIEGYWGGYPDDEIRSDVVDWLTDRIDEGPRAAAGILHALKEYCPLRFGPPDVATTRDAVLSWEKDTGIRLRRGRSEDYVPYEPTQEEREYLPILRTEAVAAGIDVSREGWLFRYMLTPEARAQHAARRPEGSGGDS